MSLVPTDIPITGEQNSRIIRQLVQTYPQCRTETLGVTAFGNAVQTLVIGRGSRRVLYAGAFHANEWITTPVILKFVEELAQGKALAGVSADEILDTATIYTVPMVNPDGVDLVTGALRPGSLPYETAAAIARSFPDIPFPEGWKANLLGVDLNLQYPAGWLQAREIKFMQGFDRPAPRDYVGRAPLTQIEARLLAGYTEAVDPALVLAYHSQGRVIYWQFRDIFVPGARELGEEFARLSGYALEDTPYASSFAGYKDWFILRFGRPGYTVEVGEGVNPLPLSQFEEIYRDNVPILVTAALGNGAQAEP